MVYIKVLAGGHYLIKSGKVREWNEENSVYYISKEKDINSIQGIKKIHKQLNHKKTEQMVYAIELLIGWMMKQEYL